jgi:5'-3' exonuclease
MEVKMIPESYKPSDKTYQGPERRMTDDKTILHDVVVLVGRIDQKIEGLEERMEQRIADTRELAKQQSASLENLLDQLRRDNEQRRTDDLQQHRDLIAAFDKQVGVTVDLYKNHEAEQDARFDDIEERVAKLEQAPGQQALNAKEKLVEIVKGALITAGAGALVAVIAALVRWDDFIKLITGGKP